MLCDLRAKAAAGLSVGLHAQRIASLLGALWAGSEAEAAEPPAWAPHPHLQHLPTSALPTPAAARVGAKTGHVTSSDPGGRSTREGGQIAINGNPRGRAVVPTPGLHRAPAWASTA